MPAALVLFGLLTVAAALVATRDVDQIREERSVLGGAVAQQCAASPPDQPAPDPEACALAEQVQATPQAPAQLPMGLDRAQVLALIDAELAARLPADQPAPVVPVELVRQVATDVLTANPELFRGPAPDPQQLSAAAAAAVAAYFADNPVQQPQDGQNGAQGLGVVGLVFDRRDGQCVAVVTLLDPADGSSREVTAPVSDTVCPQPDPEPAPEPTTTAAPDPTTPAPDPTPEGLFG